MKCPACGFVNESNLQYELYTSRGLDKNWYKCSNCKSYFLGETYDQSKEVDNALLTACGNVEYGVKVNKYKERMFLTILNDIVRINPDLKTLLDIGSSYGGFPFLAKEKGFAVTGTDIVPEAVEYMKKNGVNAQQCFSITDLQTDEKYDVVSALDCNMYFPDQPGEIESMKDLVSKNGVLVMRIVDKSWLIRMGLFVKKISHKLGNKIIHRGINDHRFSMPVKSFKKLVKDKGLNIIYFSVLDARHSDNSGLLVKASFYFGNLVYSLTGIFIAPGAVVIMKDGNAA